MLVRRIQTNCLKSGLDFSFNPDGLGVSKVIGWWFGCLMGHGWIGNA